MFEVLGLVLNFLKYGVVAAAIFFAAYQFKDMHKETVVAVKEAAKWEADYKQAKQVADDNAKALERLQVSHNALMVELADWQNRQSATENQLTTARKKVRALERENEAVRATLSTAIPCELWRQIFPNTTRCPRQN